LELYNIEPGDIHGPAVIALGNFDGVHLGHQKLLKTGLEKAKSLQIDFAVFLFYPHPLKVLYPERKLNLLTSQKERLMIFEELGIQKVYLCPFTPEIAQTSPREFVENILLKIGAVHVVVGFNYSFGAQGKGNPKLLEKLSREYGFGLSIIQAQKIRNKVISSSAIRKYLVEGEIALVQEMMGRSPRIFGRVIHGDQRGRTLGYPTANLQIDEDQILPKNGVYAVESIIQGQQYGGMMNIGFRPTFKRDSEKTIEVHFFDYQGNLYDMDMVINIRAKLRSEKKFNGPEEFMLQLAKDKTDALTVLGK